MNRRLAKVVALVIMGALLATLPVLAGCDGNGGAEGELRIGFESDFTGPACGATAPVYEGLADYFDSIKGEDVLGGVSPKFITYDHRTDYSRIPIGYVWLKTKGVKAILFPSPTDVDMLASKFGEDEICAFSTTAMESVRAHEWIYFIWETHEVQAAGVLKSIVDSWDYTGEGRSPKVGHIGYVGMIPTIAMQSGMDQFMAKNAEKLDWVGLKAAPLGTSIWTAEVLALMDCDYIVLSIYGVANGQIIKEARARGYQGDFATTSMSFGGYWAQVRQIVPSSELYGCRMVHSMPWMEPVPFNEEWLEAIYRYHPAGWADVEKQAGGYGTGWAWGMWLADIIRRAAEKVGPENVDGAAIRDAALTINLDQTAQGWGAPWSMSEGDHVSMLIAKRYDWSVETESWVAIGNWYDFPRL